jgi:hypothetical protein
MVGRPRMRLRKTTVGALLSMALFIAAPAVAIADDAAQDGYSQPAGKVQQQISHNNGNEGHDPASTSSKSSSSGNLPFTGLDLALVVAAGGVLLAMGLGIRRISRSELA